MIPMDAGRYLVIAAVSSDYIPVLRAQIQGMRDFLKVKATEGEVFAVTGNDMQSSNGFRSSQE